MWTAEPHLEQRKRIGFQVMLFLIVFAGLLYFHQEEDLGPPRRGWRTGIPRLIDIDMVRAFRPDI